MDRSPRWRDDCSFQQRNGPWSVDENLKLYNHNIVSSKFIKKHIESDMDLLKLLLEGTLDEMKAHVKANPESVKEKDGESGRLALHHAIIHCAQVEPAKIAFLLDEYPEGATEGDNSGSLPLHYSAYVDDMNAQNTTWMTVLTLLLMEPIRVATSARDCRGRLPVHRVIIAHKFNAATHLIHMHQGNIDATCEEGSLLHLALKYDAPDEFIRLIIEKVPKCLQMTDMDGDLPMHAAVDYKASIDQIQAILNMSPIAIEVQGAKGYLPLHLEAAIGGRLEVLQMLLARYENGVSQRNSEGSLPIHVALRNATISTESLNFLHEAYPHGLMTADSRGYSAFHMACVPRRSAVVSMSTIRWLLQKCPVLVGNSSDAGSHPLHYLAQNPHDAVAVLTILTMTFPRALQTTDVDGDLPLHCSVMSKKREGPVAVENVQFLVDAFPEGVRRVNSKGQLPLHIACANRNVPFEAIDLLCNHFPAGLSQYDNDGLLPIHHASSVPLLVHLIKMLKGSILPSSEDHIHALFLACERDTSLEIIMKLVECSKEMFSKV